ncbi:MAG: hypothetical protein ACI9OJ_000390 [Myxococcota bacterium]|jgi:hypothetical protein
MLLRGSCHCQAVCFSCESRHPQPYQRCYCTICRKTGGGGGFVINIEADATTLQVEGLESTSIYQALVQRDGETVKSAHERHFCRLCGSHLWAFNNQWPELLHPVAGAIDTELPAPSENVHMLTGLDSRARWVAIEGTPSDGRFPGYPEQSLAAWHQTRGLAVD